MSFVAGDIFGGSSNNYAAIAQQQEAQRESAITTGTTAINNAFAGFTPQFYQNYANSYVQQAEPQLQEQYRSTSDDIGFNLANRGLSNSSTAGQQWDNLSTSMNQAQQTVSNQGQSQAQSLQSNVQNTQNQELNTLYNSADPAQAGASATAAAASFATPAVFPVLTDMFSNLLNSYYTGQLINNYNTTLSSLQSIYSSSGSGASQPTGTGFAPVQ